MPARLSEHFILSRLAFAPGPADEQERLTHLGLPAWLAEQLDAPPDDDPACGERLQHIRLPMRYGASTRQGQEYPAVDEMRPLSTLSAPQEALWPLADYKRPLPGQERFRPRLEVAAATLVRAVYGRWQLRELMVDFWHNHFNVDASQIVQVAVALPSYDKDVIRNHALGNFRAFLESVASSTAMLYYLNNRASRTGSPNENYARELFELHSFGRENYLNALYNRWREVPGALKGHPAGFIDQDVYEAARAFTGWAVADGSGLGGNDHLPANGRFAYIEAWHDNYQKRVLGTEFDPYQPAQADGRKVLDLIASHPATARHITAKLSRRLIGSDASEKLQKRLAEQWLRDVGHPRQIARAIETIVLSADFARSRGTRIRRPLELVAAFVRGTGMDFTPSEALINEIGNAGQRLFAWGPPTGHPEEQDYWLSANGMRRRWQLVQGLADNRWGNGLLDTAPIDAAHQQAGPAAETWAKRLLGAEAGTNDAAQVLAGLGIDPGKNMVNGKAATDELRRIVAFLAMSPAFQVS